MTAIAEFFTFVSERWAVLSFLAYQHMSLVVQSLLLATVLALVLGIAATRTSWGPTVAQSLSAVGLTIPSYALLGLLVGILSIGVLPSVVILVFFGFLPILRNVVVGIKAVDPALIESARGMGMGRFDTLIRLELALAWPVVMTGVRISAQMLMGIAAIAAFALGPGLGGYIFSGISRMGGANATNSIVAGTLGIIILAIILDIALNLFTRLTMPKGISRA